MRPVPSPRPERWLGPVAAQSHFAEQRDKSDGHHGHRQQSIVARFQQPDDEDRDRPGDQLHAEFGGYRSARAAQSGLLEVQDCQRAGPVRSLCRGTKPELCLSQFEHGVGLCRRHRALLAASRLTRCEASCRCRARRRRAIRRGRQPNGPQVRQRCCTGADRKAEFRCSGYDAAGNATRRGSTQSNLVQAACELQRTGHAHCQLGPSDSR